MQKNQNTVCLTSIFKKLDKMILKFLLLHQSPDIIDIMYKKLNQISYIGQWKSPTKLRENGKMCVFLLVS